MLTQHEREISIIGGPNGAGKTTVARGFLPGMISRERYLNADEIARELSPKDPELAAMAAGRLLIRRLREFIRTSESFAIETTCAGKSYVPILRHCAQTGWRVTLYYLWLPTVEQSLARVAKRVREGGHSIPPTDIHRRFLRGLWNMRHLYLPLADVAAIYDNGGRKRILIAVKESGVSLKIVEPERWRRIVELTS